MAKEVQTFMSRFMGRGVGLGQYDQIEGLAWFPNFITTVVDYTLTAKESGSFVVNPLATEAEIEITLPAISDGPWIFFCLNSADVTMTVTAETADTLICFNNLAADGIAYSTASEKIGGAFMVCSDGTYAWAVPLGTGGHKQTSTVVDA